MSTATVEKKVPVELTPNLSLSHMGLEEFLREQLEMTPTKIFEARAHISNTLLGRNQAPTVTDGMMAERMYQSGEFKRFSYYPEWLTKDNENISLLVSIGEREGRVPKTATFGELMFNVQWSAGFRGDCTLISSFTRDIVSEFDEFRVFDDCQGFESSRCWPWVIRAERDIRAWAGNEMADYYCKFIGYAKELMGRKRADNVTVKLIPISKGSPGYPEQVRLHVQIHLGPVQLAGFTTLAEFNEVLTKEKK